MATTRFEGYAFSYERYGSYNNDKVFYGIREGCMKFGTRIVSMHKTGPERWLIVVSVEPADLKGFCEMVDSAYYNAFIGKR